NSRARRFSQSRLGSGYRWLRTAFAGAFADRTAGCVDSRSDCGRQRQWLDCAQLPESSRIETAVAALAECDAAAAAVGACRPDDDRSNRTPGRGAQAASVFTQQCNAGCCRTMTINAQIGRAHV